MRQMAEFKSGTRKGMRGGIMIQIAKAISDEARERLNPIVGKYL